MESRGNQDKKAKTDRDSDKVEASWGGLAQQMIRFEDDSSITYHPSEGAIKTAIYRLTSLTVSCLAPLHTGLAPQKPPPTTAMTPVVYEAQVESATAFVHQKISFLSVNGTNVSNKTYRMGLHFLQKRMWETLQAMLIFHHSKMREHTLSAE
ncbi:hypothetical protein PCANC_08544 [Puccinia coronata f. sp. avenae]|uniref:Uncharacterized protein n=1 Tax=Puccinia coronata f. sp. avenae TaxID=200324 RepID=A0A2N5V286_9BASI|nr:hypothetical protein PCANC_08544 [Puccinia coronata f. sp. avenae]